MALSFPLSFPPIAFVKEVSPAERAPPTFELTLCLFSISAALLYAEDAAALALVVRPYLSFTSFAFCAAATAALAILATALSAPVIAFTVLIHVMRAYKRFNARAKGAARRPAKSAPPKKRTKAKGFAKKR